MRRTIGMSQQKPHRKGLTIRFSNRYKEKRKAAKDVRSRIDATYESLREPADLVKLNACKDGLEAELNNFKSVHENVTDLFIGLGLNEREQKEHDEYVVLNNAALESLADVKVRIKDQEIERVELLSQRSLCSKKSSPSVRSSSTSSSKRAAIETAKLKAKLHTLKRRQEIDRRRDELKLQEKELECLNEQEELHGELSAAEAIQKILQESELNDTITLQEAKTSADSTEKQRLSRISDSNFLAQPQAGTGVPDEIKRQDDKVNTPIALATTPSQARDASEKNREYKNIAQLSLATRR